MKKLKIKILILVTVLGVLTSISCTGDFDKMNIDPNSPTNISPQYLLPYAIEQSVDNYWGGTTRFQRLNIDGAMLWTQYFARNIYSNEGDSYGITPAFYTNNWTILYNNSLVNLERVISQSKAGGTMVNTNYEGIALVMRSWVFSLLTDLYGPIPYKEALKGTSAEPVYTPGYDSQEVVYAGLLADLKSANEKLTVGGPTVSGDILFNGDILKWKKFANSLRLRLANRQAAKKSAESKAIFAEILGNPTTYPIFTSNADNALLQNTATRPSNNVWNQVMIVDGRTDWNLSKTLVDKLSALKDTRLSVFGNPVGGSFTGIPNGLPDAIATTYLSSASTIGNAFVADAAPSVIMTYAELKFILAEAAIDGDISGSAETYFKDGIAASFAQFKATMPADYYTTVGAVTKAKIMDQKWIALFGQGIEAWTEYRRTGLPVMPAKDPRAVFENNGVIPTRLPYPTSEYSLNKAKLDAAISLVGTDNMQVKLWWVE